MPAKFTIVFSIDLPGLVWEPIQEFSEECLDDQLIEWSDAERKAIL
jgi:hypothetical protein